MDAPRPPLGSEPWRFSPDGERLPEHCLDCGAPLTGPFCANCGQKNALEHRSLWQLVKDALGPAVLLESRLWRTLGTLLRHPGALSEAYVAGQRSRYIRPLRLYFWVSVLFFTALALRPTHWIQIELRDEKAETLPLFPELGRRMQAKSEELKDPAARDRFRTEFVTRFPKAAFFLVPVSALLLLGFWPRRDYVEHLILAVHAHTVLFLGLGLALIPLLPIRVLGWGLPCVWTPLALQRFYRSHWWVTGLKLVPLVVLYALLLGVASFGTLALTLMLE